MKLPAMKYADGIGDSTQIKFAGLDHNVGAKDGALWDMENLTGDHHPVLASRARRWKCRALKEPGGLFAWDGLCWVDGDGFFYRGERKGTVSKGPKSFASLGQYIVILPDKVCYNVDTGELMPMEARWQGQTLIFENGQLYGEDAANNCIRSDGTAWSEWFRIGDAVTISGLTELTENQKTLVIRGMDGDKLYFYDNSFSPGQVSGELGLARTVPDMDHLCANENRLWGCKGDMIYACKLGDIFNWNVMDGLDTDSYSVDTGSAGAFTGCVSYLGYPTFFKEDHIYKIYGSVPSNFEVMGSATLGLKAGCDGSLAVAGEVLFYLGRNGVMGYTGGIPRPVSEAFGAMRFRTGMAGSDGLKYYISMEDMSGSWRLYVYDTMKGMWHIEDRKKCLGFASADGVLYMLEDTGDLWTCGEVTDPPEGAEREPAVQWYAEFSDHTQEDPKKKGVGKFLIRLELEVGAKAEVWIMCDSDGQWQRAGHVLGERIKRSYYLPIVPRRADHYRIRISGVGGCRVFSMTAQTYSGSELRSTARRY